MRPLGPRVRRCVRSTANGRFHRADPDGRSGSCARARAVTRRRGDACFRRRTVGAPTGAPSHRTEQFHSDFDGRPRAFPHGNAGAAPPASSRVACHWESGRRARRDERPAPRHLRGRPPRPPPIAGVGQSERPAFTRLRTRSVGRRGTDPRPRFDAARGLLAANATALLVANGGAASVSPAGALASAGVDLRTPDGRRPLARRGRYGALPIPAARLRP